MVFSLSLSLSLSQKSFPFISVDCGPRTMTLSVKCMHFCVDLWLPLLSITQHFFVHLHCLSQTEWRHRQCCFPYQVLRSYDHITFSMTAGSSGTCSTQNYWRTQLVTVPDSTHEYEYMDAQRLMGIIHPTLHACSLAVVHSGHWRGSRSHGALTTIFRRTQSRSNISKNDIYRWTLSYF